MPADKNARFDKITVDAAMLAQFDAVRPFVLNYMSERLRPQETAWGLQLVGYAGVTWYGMVAMGWSPTLILLSFLLGLAVTLAAESFALMRIHRAGCTALLQAFRVVDFSIHMATACAESSRPTLERRFTLDHMKRESAPARGWALASTLFLLVGGLILAPALWSLSAQLGAAGGIELLVLATANLLHGVGIFRQRLAPVIEGAPWTVEFSPVARGIGFVFLAPLMLVEAINASTYKPMADVEDVEVLLGFLGGWGALTVLSSLTRTRKLIHRIAHLRLPDG